MIKNNALLTENSFKMRKYFFCRQNGEGFLKQKANQPPKDALAMMANNSMMTGMLTNNLSNIISMSL